MANPASSSRDEQEVEWQFDAADLAPVLRWLEDESLRPATGDPLTVLPRRTVTQTDVYLDTSDRRFHRAGYSLRIRRTGKGADGAGEATLKALDRAGAGAPGLRRRREISEALDGSEPNLLADAAGPVGERVRAVTGGRSLEPLFEVRTERRRFGLDREGTPAGEVALDATEIRPAGDGPPTRLCRIEVEVPEAVRAAVEPFVAALQTACNLQPAGLSKYEAGILSSGLEPPAAASFGNGQVERHATIGAVALAAIRRNWGELIAREPGARLGDDVEELHDMRVASRRLRAAIALFDDVLPDAVRARDELGWLGRALGGVRDLDVQLEQLDEWLAELPEADRGALELLRSELERQRRDARKTMLEALDSQRYTAFVTSFSRGLFTPWPPAAGPAAAPARAAAPDLIEQQFAAVRRAAKRIGPGSPASDYHRLRIRCKRLRYALEFLAGLYPGETAPLVKALVRLQNILGLHQDADVAIARLRELALDRGVGLPSGTVFAMGEIAERYRQNMSELRPQAPAAYATLAGKRWRSFRKLVEHERPAPDRDRPAISSPPAIAAQESADAAQPR